MALLYSLIPYGQLEIVCVKRLRDYSIQIDIVLYAALGCNDA